MTTPDHVYLTTNELLERIRETFNVSLDARTISAWVAREHDPLPVAFRARRGQGHKFVWNDAHPWLARELDRPLGENLSGMTMFEAKTISARARAKMDTIELNVMERKYVDAKAVEQAAEDRARQAVNRLMTLPSRLAPRLARMTDEIAIDHLLDTEIRGICREIENAAQEALGEDPLEDPTETDTPASADARR